MESSTPETFPSFFADAPVLDLIDPLAEFLGAVAGGRLRYRYEDVVRMAGHSCPTVASAFLMTRAALRRLYGDALPRRGEIRVEMRERRDAGVTGVVAAVATFVTGATEDSGFPGIGGRFGRRERLFFGRPLSFGEMRFARLDGEGAPVEVAARLQLVGGDPRMSSWMGRCLHGEASAEETAAFRNAWQERVRRLLVDHADDPEVIEVRETRA
ncbi:MAG TPA: hypothetical protein VGE10_11540 [Zeimonas sp.]